MNVKFKFRALHVSDYQIIHAIAFIARGMKGVLAIYWYITVRNQSGEALQTSIEGTIDKNILLQTLLWEGSTIRRDKVSRYLRIWIENASNSDIKKLLKAATGSNSLSRENPLKISVLNTRDSDTLPSSHTCFRQLVLPNSYRSQKSFNQKMRLFLEEALADTGFTTG